MNNSPIRNKFKTLAVFEIALSTLVDIRSTNELNFGGPALIVVDPRNMQSPKKDIIIISQGNAAWNTTEITVCIKYYTWEAW